ncbi:unnamed protein product [Staurois parvus]|uniref:Uncharacterized protein n=1 Tax=Staurois parvus TaxID=386267 RepID=A0ABN9CNP4_9NEOB|nr:unnamed protein product [Staurois parvus]
MPSLSSGHTPGINPSSSVIGRRNCSSREAHRRPITGEEVELGKEEPSGTAKHERVKRRGKAAGEGSHLTEGGSEPRLEQGSAR